MIRSIAQLKAWFRRGKYPTEEQFADWFDSYVHKDESRIPISQVDNLPEQLNGKYNASDGKLLERKQNELRQEFDSHKQDAEDEFEKIENNRQALVAEDGRLQGEIDTTNTNLEHLRKRLHPTAVFDSLENTFSALGANYSTLWALANTLKTFLEAKDTADSTINRWQEIEAFLQGITDAETLSGLLEQLEKDITADYGKAISEAVKTETDRANGVETTLQANIDKERERAEEAEAGIKRYVDDNVGGSGGIVRIPVEVLSLPDNATSDEIFNAFGGKDLLVEICQKVNTGGVVCVIESAAMEEEGIKVAYTPSMTTSTYTDSDNFTLLVVTSTQTLAGVLVNVENGAATIQFNVLNLVTEAPADDKAYARKNNNWVETVGKEDFDKSNVYKRYKITNYISDTKCVLLLWEEETYEDGASADAYYGTIIGTIYTDIRNSVKYQEGSALLQINFTGYAIKDYNLNDCSSIFGPNNFNAAIVKCTYNGKKYLALKLEVSGAYNIDEFVGCVDRTPVFKWVDYEYTYGGIMNQEVYDSIEGGFKDKTLASTEYVDKKVYVVKNATFSQVLKDNKDVQGETEVIALIGKLFGSYRIFKDLLNNLNLDKYTSVKFSNYSFDELIGDYAGMSIDAGSLFVLCDIVNGEFGCNFTYTYHGSLKYCRIDISEPTSGYLFEIKDKNGTDFYKNVWQGSVYSEDSVDVGAFTGSYYVDVLFLDTSKNYYFSASVILKNSSEEVAFRNVGRARYSKANKQIIVTTNSENIKIENINVINFH